MVTQIFYAGQWLSVCGFDGSLSPYASVVCRQKGYICCMTNFEDEGRHCRSNRISLIAPNAKLNKGMPMVLRMDTVSTEEEAALLLTAELFTVIELKDSCNSAMRGDFQPATMLCYHTHQLPFVHI